MSLTAMRSLALLVVVVSVAPALAIAPCNDKFIAGLASTKECYKDGHPPAMMDAKAAKDAVGTTLRVSKDDLQNDVKCLTGQQDELHTYVNVFWNNGSTTKIPFKHEVKDGIILQTDEKGGKFKMYIVHSEDYAFSYYKCIDGTTGGTGSPMVNVAADCKQVKNPATLAVVDRAETCFKKLGANIVKLPPCDC